VTHEPAGAEPLLVTREGPIATLWLNRPEKRNAMSLEMWAGVANACAALAGEADVRLLVVRGAGGHFCAGADIGGLGDQDGVSYAEVNRSAEAALASFPKPTIAFVQGSCIGGGMQLAAACDLRIADTTARLGITPARLGILYPAASIRRVLGLIGPSAAKHLLFSAELIDVERALRIGLVDEVHEPDAAVDRLATFSTLLAERSLLTQEASKEMIDAIIERGDVDPTIVERWSRELAASSDVREGVAAFLERRRPHFTWAGPIAG
jgi:enoyl-CoA hydratase/carnithine racemase